MGFPNHLVFNRSEDDGLELMRILQGARSLDNLFADD